MKMNRRQRGRRKEKIILYLPSLTTKHNYLPLERSTRSLLTQGIEQFYESASSQLLYADLAPNNHADEAHLPHIIIKSNTTTVTKTPTMTVRSVIFWVLHHIYCGLEMCKVFSHCSICVHVSHNILSF